MPAKPVVPRHPVLAAWFAETFGEPTDVQRRAWEAIGAGSHTLIAAPTGSGKTLAALLPCLDRLALEKGGEAGVSEPGVRVLYVTPLKALNNDIHHHALRFVEQIGQTAERSGLPWPGIRCAVRTGDTKPAERAAMLRKPPDVLVTTPESLYLLLTSERGRRMLRTVRQVIVDEIHDLAADKRGAHLSLSLERLADLCGRPVQRIGVSATQKPLERVARFLAGWEEEDEGGGSGTREGGEHALGYRPRPVRIVESAMDKALDVRVTMPDPNRPARTREDVWQPLLERLLQWMEGCRATLVFVNSRRLSERLCLRLNDHVGYEMARSHHGSLSREWRLEVERMLKAGELRCIVATSSLELGIDVGHVDLVIQLDSPVSAAAGIQRIGRAGHAVGDRSRGVIIARHKGALPEIAVLSRQIARRDIEEIRIPREPLDVLSQQIAAMAATDDWTPERLHRLVARSDNYRTLSRSRLESALEVLAGLYPFVRPLLDWDRSSGRIARRANTAIAAMMGAGTIPQTSAYPVHHADSRAFLGEVDEEFVQESKVGDVFQLGAQPWMIREIRQDRLYVSETSNRFSEIPFWRNDTGGRSYELGLKIGAFVEELAERLGPDADRRLPEGEPASRRDAAAAEWLAAEYGLDAVAADQLIGYVRAQRAVSELPTHRRIVVEHYRDVTNRIHVILHNWFGKKVNRTWLMAIQRHFERTLPHRLYGNAKDNGIEFVLAESDWDASWLNLIWQVVPSNVDALVTEALTGSPLLSIAFRRQAETSLLLSRGYSRTPLWQKRLRGAELLQSALPYAETFPYFQEAVRECKNEELDVAHLREVLEGIGDGRIGVAVRATEYPSPLASQFVADYVMQKVYEGEGLDDAARVQLLRLSKAFAGELFGPEAVRRAIDPGVLEEAERRFREPDRPPQSAGDLLRLLKQRGDLSEEELVRLAGPEAAGWLAELREREQVAAVRWNGRVRWIVADEKAMYAAFPASDESVAFVVGRFADNRLSFTEEELRERYPAFSADAAKAAVERLLELGLIEQAPFAADPSERLWSSRKVASRLIRLSIGQARRNVEPVDASRWLGRLLLRQRVLPEARLPGSDGLLAVIERLQGLFLPLSQWESAVFPARLPDYRPEALDLLCASGQVVWLGRKEEGDKEGKVAFFLADSQPLYAPYVSAGPNDADASRHPGLLRRLQTGGARFLTRLSQETGRPPSEVLADLLDLAWEGRVSNDQFAPLRLSALSRSRGKQRFAQAGSGLGRWYWTGSLLDAGPDGGSRAGSGPAASGPAEEPEQSAVQWIRHLLQTYGILTKELAARTVPYGWESLLPVLKRLEEWGVVTRGMFVRGLHALQFTTRELAEEIRQPLPSADPAPVLLLPSVDPANPYGWIVDWPQAEGASFARKPGCYLALRGGEWLYWIENNGRRIYAMASGNGARGSDPKERADTLKAIFGALLKRPGLNKITVEKWNGSAVLDTEAEAVLRSLGAERDRDALVLWPSALR